MSKSSQHKKRSYSPVYAIYRRLRFIRFKKKIAKRQEEEFRQKDLREKQEQALHLKEFRQKEKKERLLKMKAEKEEAKRLKKEFKEEFRRRDKAAKEEWLVLSAEEKKNKKLALKAERKAKKIQFRQDSKTRLRNFFLSFRSINIRSINRRIREFRDNAPKRRRFLLITANSTVLFLLSYFALFLISQAITVVAASFFDYPTIVYYFEIYFNINQEAWFHDSVKTIFSSGPVIIFVIGITFIIIYSNLKENPGSFKLFFLWGFMHAVNMLFGALLVGTLFETGVGHVISWMYVMDTGKVLYSILSIFMLVISGLIATKPFLISANTYYNEMNENNKTSFIIAQVLLPYLLSNAALLVIRQPRFVFYDTFILVALFLSLLPILVTYRSYSIPYFEEEEKKPGFVWIPLAVLTLAVLFFRVVLAMGLRFNG